MTIQTRKIRNFVQQFAGAFPSFCGVVRPDAWNMIGSHVLSIGIDKRYSQAEAGAYKTIVSALK